MPFSRLRWKIHRLRERVQERVSEFSGPREGRPAVCPRCGKLVGIKEPSCAECGSPVRGITSLPAHLIRLLPPSAVHRLLLVNVALYLVAVVGTALQGAGGPSGVGLRISPRVLLALGAGNALLVAEGEIWRVVTPIFLHWNLPHILFNSVALAQLCPDIEEISGRGKFLTFYIVSGVMGNLTSFWYHGPFGLLAGASGAIFGMLGVLMVFGLRRGGSFGRMIWWTVAQWAIYALLFAFVVRADNAAHLGGLAGGAVLAFVFGPERDLSARAERAWTLVGRGCVLVTVLSFAGVLLSALDL